MEGIVLLSELHPLATRYFNPIRMAINWFGLLSQDDIANLQKKGNISYPQAIELIEQRSRERGDILVLRDWAHLDFIGLPLVTSPPYRPLLYSALENSFDIIRISTTRDPVTQWKSLIEVELMLEPLRSGAFGLDQYLAGYRKYAELCIKTGFIRYEDFLLNPDLEMRKLCEQLQIDFDPDFINKWHDYKTITGDINNPRSSNQIKMPPSRPIEPDLRKKFLANEDYHRACELLGYELLAK
jgi:hypothetical protein